MIDSMSARDPGARCTHRAQTEANARAALARNYLVYLLAEYQFRTRNSLRALVWTLHICTSVPARPRPPTNMCQNAPAPVPTPTRAHDSPRTLTVYTLCTSFVQARGTQPYSLT